MREFATRVFNKWWFVQGLFHCGACATGCLVNVMGVNAFGVYLNYLERLFCKRMCHLGFVIADTILMHLQCNLNSWFHRRTWYLCNKWWCHKDWSTCTCINGQHAYVTHLCGNHTCTYNRTCVHILHQFCSHYSFHNLITQVLKFLTHWESRFQNGLFSWIMLQFSRLS